MFPPVKVVQLSPTRIPEIMRDPLAFLLQSAQEHGSFIHYPLQIANVYNISHPEIIQHVLQTNSKNYSKDTVQYNTLAQITGEGLLTSDGRSWLTHRRLMQPAFHRTRLEGFGDTIVNATAAMLDRWETAVQSGLPLDIDAEMMQVTLEIVGKTLFHLDLRADAPEMTHAALGLLEYVVYRAQTPIALPTGRAHPPQPPFQSAHGPAGGHHLRHHCHPPHQRRRFGRCALLAAAGPRRRDGPGVD